MSHPEKLPPANPDAERGVLGSILLNPEVIHEVISILHNPGDFYLDHHQVIYGAILELADRGRPLDLISIAAELTRRGAFEKVGGNDALVEIVESVPHAAHARYYAELVRQKAISRSLIDAHENGIRDGYSNQFSAEELLARSEAAIFGIGQARNPVELVNHDQAGRQCRAKIDRDLDHSGQRLRSGIAAVDGMIGSFQPGHLVVIGARTSIGKSALLLGFADAVATQCRETGAHVLYVSLEMSATELAGRALSGRSGVNGRFINGQPEQLTDDDWDRIDAAQADLAGQPMLISDSPGQTVSQIASHARRLRRREGLAMVCVDYLQLITPDPRLVRSPRHVQVGRISRDLKCLAEELAVPILVCCQVSREAERDPGAKSRKVPPPRMAHLRESGDIEQDANLIMLLHRPEQYDPDDRPGEADLIIEKNRGGRTGTIKLRYQKRITRFSEFEEPLVML